LTSFKILHWHLFSYHSVSRIPCYWCSAIIQLYDICFIYNTYYIKYTLIRKIKEFGMREREGKEKKLHEGREDSEID